METGPLQHFALTFFFFNHNDIFFLQWQWHFFLQVAQIFVGQKVNTQKYKKEASIKSPLLLFRYTYKPPFLLNLFSLIHVSFFYLPFPAPVFNRRSVVERACCQKAFSFFLQTSENKRYLLLFVSPHPSNIIA
jgi:hypothetical protein